ncbi:MAG: bifunctional glutamate N-acetyltransferase/amino-acid acetyltransferase ArgJ [Nevskia sp.]|nr:bifunctional glutamate N-acetyltransferase/amino-acid acetyltransferase ArgJ [Nevskia sp.]
MPVNLKAPDSLPPVPGVRLGTAEAAIKKPGREDLLLVALAPGTRVAGVFTRNAFAAAPVQLCRERLGAGREVRAWLVNSGNANAATGGAGLADARACCAAAAQALACAPEQVLPFSTGVIGQRLPVERLCAAIPRAAAALREDGWIAAARAIMTTDTVPKGASRRVKLSDGASVTVTGIAKGVGMIRPDLATLLAFVATDARLSPAAARSALSAAVAQSFNCISVDGDTSTNDSCVLAATARAGTRELDEGAADYRVVAAAIEEVCVELAQACVRDGEGATKFVTVEVRGARHADEARRVAYAIADSPLVKTALFAGDANWGRIVMAVGKAGVESLDPARVRIALDEVPLVENGGVHPAYREELGAAVVARPEFAIRVDLGRGAARARVWTCDFSYDYVRINAEYRT